MSTVESKPCVLIVDDDPDLAMIMRLVLTHAGFEAHSVLTGKDAMDWLGRRKPDVLLLDLMMPDINGFTVLRHLRAQDTTHNLPVIILTAKADQKTRSESQDAGANAFLTKPINSKSLVEHVKKALDARGAAPSQNSSAPDAGRD